MKLPDLKLPDLRKRSAKPSGGTRPSVKAPKFATDLYADLRDRRLLPLVALLLVAIAAAPFLLGGDDETPEAPVQPVEPSAEAAQASFSVVPAEPVLRDYRRRLGYRDARSPFAKPASAVAAASGGKASGSRKQEGGGSATSGVPAGEAPAGEAPVESGTGEAPAGGEGESEVKTEVVVQNEVLGYEIDAKAGFVGHVHPREGIPPTTKLPSPQNPVIVFMGLSKDNKRALFLMSSKVTAYYGKARCALDRQACQLVELKPGKSATFAYGFGDARYKLTLRKIVPVVKRHEADAVVTTKRSEDGGLEAGE